MSLESAKVFMENVSKDPDLARSINGASNPEIFSYAKANGCDFTIDELRQVLSPDNG
jgi:bacteriocin propeptide, TIGR03798 family